MKSIIEAIYNTGYSSEIYYGFHALGFVAVLLFALWYGKRIDISRWKSAGIVFIAFPVLYVWMFVFYWLETGFFGGNNIVRVFAYLPIVGYAVAKILKIEWRKVLDLLAYCPLIIHGICHFACIIEGCCYGYPCDWGIYNPFVKAYLFPIQPIEALTAWAIIFYLFYRHKRNKGTPDGLEAPIMLIQFGSTRFIWEFFRDNDKLIWGVSNLAFHALFMFVVGLVLYFSIKAYNKRHKNV